MSEEINNGAFVNIKWISTEIELPPKDGYYLIASEPTKYFDVGYAFYDGLGFMYYGIYRNPAFWSQIPSFKKKYGKICHMN